MEKQFSFVETLSDPAIFEKKINESKDTLNSLSHKSIDENQYDIKLWYEGLLTIQKLSTSYLFLFKK